MRRKILLSVISLMVLVLGSGAAAHAADKVGYINLQRLVNESKMGKAARADIQKMRQEKEAFLKARVMEFNSLKDFINNNSEKMTPAEKNEKIEDLRKAYKEYQRLLADAKEEVVREDKELVAIILQKADDVLKKVAKKYKYSIILKDPNAIGYLDEDYDITDRVLKELDKKK